MTDSSNDATGAAGAGATSPPEQAARDLIDRYWEQLLELEPILGTEVGDERFDDRLDDRSEEGRAHRDRVQRDALAAVTALDRGDLSEDVRTALDMIESIATRDIDAVRFRLDRFAAVSHLWGPGQLLAIVGSLQKADSPERLDRYVARLRSVPAYLEEVGRTVTDAARAGQTVSGVVADRAIAQVERQVAAGPEDSPALRPVASGSDADRERVAEVVRDEVMPAYAAYLDTLRAYRPAAREGFGLCELPDGEAMYAALINSFLTIPLDAATVHETGLEKLAATRDERREIARSLGFEEPNDVLADLQASGRNTASTKDELVGLAERQVRRGWDAAPEWFGRVPDANCEVRAVEEFREADMPFAFYQVPNPDGSRPGVYYVNASELSERPLHHLATTTYHEANPGHHFQLALEIQRSDRVPLRRFGGLLSGGAFIEGWGLYSERLADEMGLFETEFERMGMLDAQAMRAARLVVDTGLHAFGWSRERSISTMEEAGLPHLDAVVETDRYIAIPGQALTYMIGQIEIENTRRELSARPGFSLKDFHDRVLSLGSIPLLSLRRELLG